MSESLEGRASLTCVGIGENLEEFPENFLGNEKRNPSSAGVAGGAPAEVGGVDCCTIRASECETHNVQLSLASGSSELVTLCVIKSLSGSTPASEITAASCC